MVNFDEVAGRGKGQYPPGKHNPGPPYPATRNHIKEARRIVCDINLRLEEGYKFDDKDAADLVAVEQLLRSIVTELSENK